MDFKLRPTFRNSKEKIISEFQRKCAKNPNIRFVMIGDSIVSNFGRHCFGIWEKYFPMDHLNLGIPGDKIEHVWDRIKCNGVPKNARAVVIHVGSNNIQLNTITDITQSIVAMCDYFISRYRGTSLIVSAILPRLSSRWNDKIQTINNNLETQLRGKCYFVTHDTTKFHKSHFWHDGLHLSADGYVEYSSSFHQFSFKKPTHSSVLKCNHFKYEVDDFPVLQGSMSYKEDLLLPCVEIPKLAPVLPIVFTTDTDSLESPRFSNGLREKQQLKGIVRRRARHYAKLLPPHSVVDFEAEYEPWEPRRNNRGIKNMVKTPDSSII